MTDPERKFRVGIAAKTLDDLKRKTLEKFKLSAQLDIYFQTPDGTLIENNEYFQTLDPQTLLVWSREGERAQTDAELLYRTIREVNEEYLTAGEKVQEFFSEKMKNKVFKLAEVLRGIDRDRAKISAKDGHPEWFEGESDAWPAVVLHTNTKHEFTSNPLQFCARLNLFYRPLTPTLTFEFCTGTGLDTRAKTKEDYMFRRAQDRIRTYYYKTRDELLRSNGVPQTRTLALLDDLNCRLKNARFFGCYFDRSAPEGRICDGEGDFACQGRWDRDACLYGTAHRINPYTSREERIIFQTWNLDHQKERSRAVVPAIREALQVEDGSLDVKAIFGDLFTLKNLKFVHVVCHDKGAHFSKSAGPYLLY